VSWAWAATRLLVGRSLTRVMVEGPELIPSPNVTIESLPDNALLDVFDFYQMGATSRQSWHKLVHVCRRWRFVVFASPRRLGLQLLCKGTTPVKKTLDVWPRLPIVIFDLSAKSCRGDNIVATLEHRGRIREIYLSLGSSVFERLVMTMQKPFPELTKLFLLTPPSYVPSTALHDTFLGGSAPCLQSLTLARIPFPGLPRFLQSFHGLTTLCLLDIPNTGYFSPEAMAECLSKLTVLKTLEIRFRSPPSRPDRRHPPPLTRVVHPALTKLMFQGASEYFEDLMALIDTPVLGCFEMIFFSQLPLNIPQLPRIVGLMKALGSFKRVNVSFAISSGHVALYHDLPNAREPHLYTLLIGVSCGWSDGQISSLSQICSQLSFLFSNVEQLEINHMWTELSGWEDAMDHMQWIELFQPFIAVKNVHIDRGLEAYIVPALQELTGDRVMEVLPALRSLSLRLSGGEILLVQKALQPFVTARQLNNHPVTVNFEKGFYV
jgi:F-box-like